MTVPLPHGYPDYGRYQAGADKILEPLASFTITGVTDIGTYFIGDVTHVRFTVTALVNHLSCVAQFYEDAALTRLIALENFDLRQGTGYRSSVPAHGPYLRLRVTNQGGNCDCQVGVSTAHASWRAASESATANVLFAARDVVHGVGTTPVGTVGVIPGQAWFYGRCTAANTFIDLNAIRADGTVFPLTRIINADGGVIRGFCLPPAPVQLVVINNSGAGQFFDYSLTASYGNLG